MVAEPTLFLSRDELIQVRVHTTKKGTKVYCVRDFIRMIANKQLKPSEALIYWMSAASSRELRSEHDIQDQYAIQFIGPYEPKNMCITAGGLLILFHHMDKRWGLILDEYKEEIQQRLTILVEGGGAEYVWDYDDGEVDTMTAAKDEAVAKGEGLNGPPENWKYFFDDQDALDPAMANQVHQQCVEAVAEMSIVLEEEAACAVSVVAVNHDKKASFSLKGLMQEMEIKIDQAFMPAMGKAVSARFREMCPESETFSKKKTTYFYEPDRECLEKLIREEYFKYVMRKADEEFEDGAGK